MRNDGGGAARAGFVGMGRGQRVHRMPLVLGLLLLVLIACGCSALNSDLRRKDVVVDSVGRRVELALPVERAVVANSHTLELIQSIGNSLDHVVGVDGNVYFDRKAYGDRFREENLIGQNQRSLNYERIVNLKPEVLIISGNGHWQEAEEQLAPFGIRVLVLNAYYTGEFRQNCELIGRLFGYEAEAEEFTSYFEEKMQYIRDQLAHVPKRTLYFEYRSPYTTVTPGRPYYKMLEFTGAKNVFDDASNPSVDAEAVVMRDPEYIVKASESYEWAQHIPPSEEEFLRRKERLKARPAWDHIRAVKEDNILLLSHYAFGGAAEMVGTCYIAKFLYPEYLPDLHPEEIFMTWTTKYQHIPYMRGHTYPAFELDD